jgi:hypothetical protein
VQKEIQISFCVPGPIVCSHLLSRYLPNGGFSFRWRRHRHEILLLCILTNRGKFLTIHLCGSTGWVPKISSVKLSYIYFRKNIKGK